MAFRIVALCVVAALPVCASFATGAPAFPRSVLARTAAAPAHFGPASTSAAHVAAMRQLRMSAEGQSEDASPLESAKEAAGALYRFSRPHTIRGTLLACFTGVARALIEAPSFLPLLPAMMPRALLGVLALLLGNLFIVGINQIYDVGIDKVNKPFLPIAAGRLSTKAAWAIVISSGLAALGIVKAIFSPLIFYLFLFGTTVGGLYSVPPFQLKRFPLAAGMTIAT
jgi:homogentisate solanesyltransferase